MKESTTTTVLATLSQAIALKDVTPEMVRRALAIDRANDDYVGKQLSNGVRKATADNPLPGNWEAASDLPELVPELEKVAKLTITNAMMNAAEHRSVGPFVVALLRFLSLGFELGVIASTEAQAKAIN